MNKFLVIGTIAAVTLAALVLMIRSGSSDKTISDPQITPIQTISATQTTSTDNPATYLEYSKSLFESASGTKRVLFFYASWCPTCRPADADFRQNAAQIPEGVTVIRVNYNDPETDDEEKALATQYGVTYQHTYVQIDENGQEISKWNGGSLEELRSNIK